MKRCFITLLFLTLFFFNAASAEELRITCWEGYAPERFVVKFEKMIKDKYGVDLKVRFAPFVSDPSEFFEAVRSGRADIISPALNIPKSERWPMIESGLLLPLDLDNIPNYRNVIAPLQKADYITRDGKVYGVPYAYGPYGLYYNTSIVKEAPVSWSVFWAPVYAGKYAISADYHEVNVYITALACGYSRNDIFDFDKINTPLVREKLSYLAENADHFWTGVDTARDLKGYAIATSWGFALPELKKMGEVWKLATPVEGTTGWVDNWLIGYSLKDKPLLKKIAEEWLNYMLSPEIQIEVVMRSLNSSPAIGSIKDLISTDEAVLYHLDDPRWFEKNLIPWKALNTRSQNAFEKMWKGARAGRADSAEVELSVVTEEWRPYNYLENNEVKGTSTEIVKMILERAKMKYKIGVYPWARAYNMALNEKNTLIYTIVRTPQRENQFKWVCPLGKASANSLYRLKSKPEINPATVEDAKKYKIATYKDTVAHMWLKNNGFENLDVSGTSRSAIRMFFEGGIDMIAIADDAVKDEIKNAGFDPEEIVKVMQLSVLSPYMALSRTTSGDTLIRLQKAYDELVAEKKIGPED